MRGILERNCAVFLASGIALFLLANKNNLLVSNTSDSILTAEGIVDTNAKSTSLFLSEFITFNLLVTSISNSMPVFLFINSDKK